MGKVRDILDLVVEVAWPTRCIGCDLPGQILCDDCREALPWIEQRLACPVCGTPFGHMTCSGCRRGMRHSPGREARERAGLPEGLRELDADGLLSFRWPMRATICALSLEGTVARVVTGLKEGHELRLAPLMAAALSCALDEASAWPATDGRGRFDPTRTDAICFVPATAAAYARRGFDHMELVARPLSALIDVPVADVLVRDEALDQRRLGRERRAKNLGRTIGVVGDVAGLDLLLIDDVVTTGASIAASTRALLARGAASVTACSFARAW